MAFEGGERLLAPEKLLLEECFVVCLYLTSTDVQDLVHFRLAHG